MRVTTLVDNSPGPEGLVSEHGLSLGISIPGKEILFDTGPSPAIAVNARILDYDLERVDLAILSHGHYDHAGGLEAFFEVNSEAPLYLMRGAEGEFYVERNDENRYIGLDKRIMKKNAGRLRWVEDSMSLGPDVHLITTFPRCYDLPRGNSALKEKRGDHLIQDTFGHELALVIKEEDGITIFTGCGHSGVLNMVSAARSMFPKDSIKAMVGGFHQIMDPSHPNISGSSVEVRNMGRELVHLGCSHIYGGHCTGPEASRLLKEELGDAYNELHTGLKFDI